MFPHRAGTNSGRARRWASYGGRRIPQQAYTQTATVNLAFQSQAVVNASGFAEVSIGPSGVGTKWYPVSLSFSTTTGIGDGSSVSLFYGVPSPVSNLFGPAPGGQGITGLSVTMMVPGDVATAQWMNAQPGDYATLTVLGTQDVLVAM